MTPQNQSNLKEIQAPIFSTLTLELHRSYANTKRIHHHRNPLITPVLGEPEERVLALRCAMYPAILLKATNTLDTSLVTNYLLSLTKEFNRFYKHHSVLSPPTNEIKRARIELCRMTQLIIQDGLQVLTINILESM